MKANLLRLIDELSGKINPPMWTIFAYYFYLALKEGKNYDEAKVIGRWTTNGFFIPYNKSMSKGDSSYLINRFGSHCN